MNSNLVYICNKSDISINEQSIQTRLPHKYFDCIYKHSPTVFPTTQISKTRHQVIINDINIGSLNYFTLDLLLPALGGINQISWCKYFGYKMVRNITFKLDDTEIYSLDTMAILCNVLAHPKANEILKLSGENEEFRTIRKGTKSYDILIPEQYIQVYIPTCFDSYIRFGSCNSLVKGNKKLVIEIEFNNLIDCINSINGVNFDNELQLRKIQLLACTFNRIEKEDKDYIETISSHMYDINDTNIRIPFDNFSKVKWMYTYNNKNLIYYPTEYCSEKEFKYKFEKYIAKNTFVVFKNSDREKLDKKDTFILIKNNIIKLHDTGNEIYVYIDNIPEGYSLYYNTKVLYFRNKKLRESLNFSEKFIKVTGRYSNSENKIKFEKIITSFTYEDISIPDDVWKSDINDEGEDNRLFKKSYIINDINIGGKDLFGHVSPVTFTTIKLGCRPIFEDEHTIKVNNIISTDAWNKIYKLEIIPTQANFIFKNILPIEEEDIRTITFDPSLKKIKKIYKTDVRICILVFSNVEI